MCIDTSAKSCILSIVKQMRNMIAQHCELFEQRAKQEEEGEHNYEKQLSLAMAGVMALSLAACGGSSASSAATSTAEAASSAAESTAESTAAEGNVLDQAAAAAFAQDVTLTMWGAEEDQDLLREISDKFIEKYGNYGGKITINLGTQSESTAKDTVLTDPTAAADVYALPMTS